MSLFSRYTPVITYLSLINHDLVRVWISDVAEGMRISDVVGRHPWEVSGNYQEKEWRKAAGRERHCWELAWEPDGIPPKVFFTTTRRVDTDGILLIASHCEFPIEFRDLSPAERLTLAGIGSGESIKQLAADQSVSESTIRSNVARIRDKMSLYTKEQISLLAFQYWSSTR